MPLPRTEITISHRGDLLLRSVLTPGQYVVGSASSDLLVDLPGISPRHARLSLQAHLLTVEDLGSEQGTFINGRRITDRTRLFPNQKLSFGSEVELSAARVYDPGDDPEATFSIQQAYVDRLLPLDPRQSRKYEVEEEVARGGMGTVFRARETSVRRAVAMKVMLSQASERAVARFIQEAQVTGQLEHPNIVPVHELGVDEHDQIFYTMKYVRGTTLKEVLSRLASCDPKARGQFPLSQLLVIFEKVCDAVAFAHSRRVIHRDLKPENIMLGKFGEVLVMDWGLAAILPGAPVSLQGDESTVAEPVSLLTTGLLRQGEDAFGGTPQYMAPEQARGETGAIDTRCDIYALGAILFNILFLEPPIAGKDVGEVLENVRAGRTRLSSMPSGDGRYPHCGAHGPPVSLIAVVRKAMAPVRQDRYASVTELQAEIRTYSAGFATEAEQAGILRHFLLGLMRYKREATLLAAFVLVLALVGGVALARVLQERQRAESALGDLRATAPSFIHQAGLLAIQQQFEEALEKLEYALRLQPGAADAYLLKGDLLQAKLRLPEAAAAYREAGRLAPALSRASTNAELCERLAAYQTREDEVPRQALAQLYEAMVAERRPPALLLPISKILGQENALTRQAWRERLDHLATTPDRPWETRLLVRADGQLKLDLSDLPISNLSLLAEMPIAELNLRNCEHVQDLSPLRALPLRSLTLDGTRAGDLSPLKNLKLEELSIAGAPVEDLSPLAGHSLRRLDCSNTSLTNFSALAQTRLESLSLSGTSVGDLWFLHGLPLRVLQLDGCRSARGFSVLLDLPNLEVLTLPRDFHALPVEEITSIRALSRQSQLRQIGSAPLPGSRLGRTENAEVFWKEWEADLAWLEVLLRAARGSAERMPDGSWSVNLRDSPVIDLGFLKGARISKLDLFATSVSDLRPLSGMPLEYLDMRLTKVSDLAPLHGLPLKELLLWKNQIPDYSPLSSLTKLEVLDLTETNFADLGVLKTPRMRLLRVGSTRITDLAPLSGMSLEKLHCDSVEVTSIRPLLQCKGMRWLIPPAAATDVELLRGHPTLQRLSYQWLSESEPDLAVDQFWKDWQLRR